MLKPGKEAERLTGGGTGFDIQAAGRSTEPVGGGRRKTLRRAINIAGSVLFTLLLLMMCFLVFFLVQSRITGGEPSLAGYRLYIVLSDSMAPAFKAGSMVMVRPVEPESLKAGDIITFHDPAGGATSITHRIADVHAGDEPSFTTRGDANNRDDAEPVPAGKVIGKVVGGAVPYAGYLMHWSRSKTGLLALVIVPGLLVIVLELRNLFRYISELEGQKKGRSKAAGPGEDGEESQAGP